MPQLDVASNLGQSLWCAVCLYVFCLLVKDNILPTVSRIIKTRKKKVTSAKTRIVSLTEEQTKVASDYDKIMVKSLQNSAELLTKSTVSTTGWTGTMTKTISQMNSTRNFNGAYLFAVTEVKSAKEALSGLLLKSSKLNLKIEG